MTALTTVFTCAEETPDEWALVDESRTRSWLETACDVAKVAHALPNLCPADAPLAVFGGNCADTVLTYAGAVIAGQPSILVNHHLTADEVAYILRDGGAGAVWATTEHADVAAAAAKLVGVPLYTNDPADVWTRAVAVASSAPPFPYPGSLATAPDTDAASRSLLLNRASPGNLIYTSGTTGFPKGVVLSVQGPATIADRLSQMAKHHAAGLGPHLVAGPLYHGGPHAAIGLLLTGTPVVVPSRFDAAVVLELIERYAVASSVMVPTHFVRLLGLPDATRQAADVSSLRMVAQTGSSCPLHVKRAMIEWFGPVFRESYGASESGIVSFITSEEWLTKPGSVGRAQRPFEAFALDDDGKVCPPGESGRLYFRDATGRGIAYRNDPEKSAAAHLAPGVFTLGDYGHLDEDGYLYVTGRGSDMVISGGVNIYPAECERVLIAHDQVLDAAVFGMPDEEMGERLVGIARVEGSVTGDELVAYCRDRIAHYKVPRDIRIVPEVPRTPMGKIVKEELAATYEPVASPAPTVGAPSPARGVPTMPESDETPSRLDICPVCGEVVANGDTATIYRVEVPEGTTGAPLVMLHPECAAKGTPSN